MKIKEVVTRTREIDINITGATLLNRVEYEHYRQLIPSASKATWWLHPFGTVDEVKKYSNLVPFVDSDGSVKISCTPWEEREVRPVLIFDPCDIEIGARFKFGGYTWTALSATYALCDVSICTSPFRTIKLHTDTKNLSNFEESDVKFCIENWFEYNNMEG